VVVLYRGIKDDIQCDTSLGQNWNFGNVAYHYARKKFNLLTGGSHAVSESVAETLLRALCVQRGARTWEIGCGRPALAAAISACTAQAVICTDVLDTYAQLTDIASSEMSTRDVGVNKTVFAAASWLKWEDIGGPFTDWQHYKPNGPDLLGLLKKMFPDNKFPDGVTLQGIESLAKPVRAARRPRNAPRSESDESSGSGPDETGSESDGSGSGQDETGSESDGSGSGQDGSGSGSDESSAGTTDEVVPRDGIQWQNESDVDYGREETDMVESGTVADDFWTRTNLSTGGSNSGEDSAGDDDALIVGRSNSNRKMKVINS
jgi:hypothetical protein